MCFPFLYNRYNRLNPEERYLSMPADNFHHNVYFWLPKGGTPDNAPKLVKACRDYLSNIPGIVAMEVGIPAGTQRSVVDNSYAVALLLVFESKPAYEAYDVHPAHLRFVDDCSNLWGRVQIYDSVPA